jgi:hypothetical protein
MSGGEGEQAKAEAREGEAGRGGRQRGRGELSIQKWRKPARDSFKSKTGLAASTLRRAEDGEEREERQEE